MCAYTHGGGAHRQRVSATFRLGKTLTNFVLGSGRDSNLWSWNPLDLEARRSTNWAATSPISEYIQKSRTVRNDTDQLLQCYTKPFGPASKDSIARWLKSVLLDAGIQNCAPHHFRGATASAMFNSGSSVDDILKSAGWSQASTFYKFYKKPLEEKDKKVSEENSICRYFEHKPKMGSNTEWIVSKSKKYRHKLTKSTKLQYNLFCAARTKTDEKFSNCIVM